MYDKKAIQNLTDTDLIHQFKTQDDNQCLAILFERYSHFVFCVCLKYLHNAENSEDASIQIFIQLMEDLKKHEIKFFKSWLYSITKNYCLMQLRVKNKVLDFELYEKKIVNGSMEFPSNEHLIQIENELQLKTLEEAILLLDFEQKTCIEMFYIQQKSYKEVALINGFTMNEVKSYIQNGKRNLKHLLIKSNNFDLFLVLILIDAIK